MKPADPIIDDYGTYRWYDKHGRRHRTDGAAVEYTNGTKYWYQHGQLHRTNGPAFEHGVTKCWYLNDCQYTEAEFQLILFINSRVTV